MAIPDLLYAVCGLAPAVLMAAWAGFVPLGGRVMAIAHLWRVFLAVSWLALMGAGLLLVAGVTGVTGAVGSKGLHVPGIVTTTPLSAVLAVLVQLLCTVIAAFSARYLDGESNQRRYVAALAAVLACVHLLLLADHWLVLIAAWAAVGMALQRLLCFYADRPFAVLAAHKKRMADRLADVLLLVAAALAWGQVGSGSLTALWHHMALQGPSWPLHASAILLVLAVALRTAVLPVHGWLIQVMEAPTPVSALLHAGVVNLGGFVLIRFAPLLEQAMPARVLLLALGLTTAVLAGLVMLTRISIKVRLAWSTVAQMGFMLLECALGLYTLAALHLVGHSLYKAHAFLSASSIVAQSRAQALRREASPSRVSLALAPVMTVCAEFLVLALLAVPAWPWWWSGVLGLAWAPLLWRPAMSSGVGAHASSLLFGVMAVLGLTVLATAAHTVPLGLRDAPQDALGVVALVVMTALYLCQALLQTQAPRLSRWRRWSYAGFYLDEVYTRWALRLWPVCWGPSSHHTTLVTPRPVAAQWVEVAR